LIKDHHKTSISCVKFCDWLKERPTNLDKKNWMICSIDIESRVIISKIYNVAFRILSVEKIVVIDPTKF